MADVRVQTLADALGVPAGVGATLRVQVYEGLFPAVRVAGELVTFPVEAQQVLTGSPGEVFTLYTLPPNLYWRVTVHGASFAVVRNVILPAGSGPFDFADLVDVDPVTALPDPGSALADAFIAELEAIRDATIAIAVDDFSVATQVTSGPLTGAALDAAIVKLGDARFSPRGLIPITDDVFATGDGVSPQASNTGTGWTRYTAVHAATGIRLVFGNWFTSSVSNTFIDSDGPANVTIKASVEISGAVFPVRFGGKVSFTIESGGMVITDPLGINVNAGQELRVRVYIDGSAGTWYPTKLSYQSIGFGGFVANQDHANDSVAIPESIGAFFAPMAILGTAVNAKALEPAFIVGDSIANGTGDLNSFHGRSRNAPSNRFGGYIARALYGKVGYINASMPSDRGFNLVANGGHFRRFSLMNYCRVMICQHGRNDIVAGQTLAQAQATLLAIWRIGLLAGLRVYQTTVTPTTTSTDSWATVGNQTIMHTGTSETYRTGLNDWIRAGAPIDAITGNAVAIGAEGALVAGGSGHPLSGYWEVADIAETARNSGIWKAGYTADGGHPNNTGAQALSAAIDMTDFEYGAA